MKVFPQALVLVVAVLCTTAVAPAPSIAPEHYPDVFVGAKPDPHNTDAFRPFYEMPPKGMRFCRRPDWDFQCNIPYGYGTRVKFGWGHEPITACIVKIWNSGSIMGNVWHAEPDGASGAGCTVKKIGFNRFQVSRSEK